MRQRLRSHLTYANVTATLALFLVLSGGTAVALSGSNTVFSDDITDNQVYSADVRNDSLTGGGLVAADLRAGSVGTSEVINGSIASGDLAPAARGARAYGVVVQGVGSPVVSRSKNVTAVTNPQDGEFCITLGGGIDPATATLVVSSDFSLGSTSVNGDDVSIAQWASSDGFDCAAGTLTVLTYYYNGDSTDNDHGGGDTTGDDLVAANQGFDFVVP